MPDPKPAKPRVLDGTVITWDDPELVKDLKEAMEASGYTFDGKGIKEALADYFFGDEDEEEVNEDGLTPGQELGQLIATYGMAFLERNPHVTQKMSGLAKSMWDKMKKAAR